MNKTMKPTEEDDGDVYINGWSKLEFEKRLLEKNYLLTHYKSNLHVQVHNDKRKLVVLDIPEWI